MVYYPKKKPKQRTLPTVDEVIYAVRQASQTQEDYLSSIDYESWRASQLNIYPYTKDILVGFSSWDEAIGRAGLKTKRVYAKEQIYESETVLMEYVRERPNLTDKFWDRIPQRGRLLDSEVLCWNRLWDLYLSQMRKGIRTDIDAFLNQMEQEKERSMKALEAFVEKNAYRITKADWNEYARANGYLTVKQLSFLEQTTWANVLNAFGATPTIGSTTPVDHDNSVSRRDASTLKRRKASTYTREEHLQFIVSCAQELHVNVSQLKMADYVKLAQKHRKPSFTTLGKVFGTWRNAKRQAEVYARISDND